MSTVPLHGPPPKPPQRPTYLVPVLVGLAAVLLVCGGLGALLVVNAAFGGGDQRPLVAASPGMVGPSAAATSDTPTAPVAIEMPDVVGKNAAVAKDELERAGFTKVELGSVDKTDQYVVVPANWRVTAQSAAAGDRVDPDAVIVLTCEKVS